MQTSVRQPAELSIPTIFFLAIYRRSSINGTKRSHQTGNTSANHPSSPIDYTLSDIEGVTITDTRPAHVRVGAIFDNALGSGWEERLGIPRRHRAYSEADTTIASVRIPGSFIPPRPSTPLPRRQPIPDFTPPSQSSSRPTPQPNQSTPFHFQSSTQPNPLPCPRIRPSLPSDLSFILSPSFSFRPPHILSPPPPPPPPPGFHPSTSALSTPSEVNSPPAPTTTDKMDNRHVPPHQARLDLEEAKAQLEEKNI
ncbi:hypothetical protein MJO29_008677 [Puccinia striiformis f. sp. tritici]|nr:hypothetical protein MJO29_008677 [Puccinia striiformis f. sp. tritici]